MRKSRIFIKLCFVFAVLFCSCSQNLMDIRKSEFSISEPEYRTSAQDPRCAVGGVYFTFYNRADCSVTYLETRMNVYDRKTGKNAFTGQGTITSSSEVKIKSREKRELCIPLDDYITVVSSSGYIIDQFYVSCIEYEDGRIWKDEFGVYATGGGE